MAIEQLISGLNAVTPDEINAEISTQLSNYIKNSDSTINRIFFGGAGGGFLQAVQANDGRNFPKMYISNVLSWVTDYNFNTTVKNVRSDVQAWFSARHQSVGETIVLNYFGTKFSSYVSPDNASALKAKLCDSSFITGFMNDAFATGHYHKILNYWLMMKLLDGSALQEVVNKWNTVDRLKDIVSTYPSYQWLDSVNSRFSPEGVSFAEIINSVRNACNTNTLASSEPTSDAVGSSSSGAPFIKHYTINYYTTGLDVKNWIESSGEYYTGARLSLPTSQIKTDAPPPSLGCVVGGTKIVLKGGAVKAIETIRAGDKVSNHTGDFSLPSGELVVSKHVECLYALNADAPFMSLDHVILTPQGYKCLDPKAAKLINPGIKVEEIKKGDSFYRCAVDRAGNITLKVESVRQINVAQNKENLPCYDIHISDGRKNYITKNGYVCFANYPEITAGTVIDGLKRVNRTEEFMNLVKANRALFEAAFGKVAVEYFLTSI